MLQKHHDDTWGQKCSDREHFPGAIQGLAVELRKSSSPHRDGILARFGSSEHTVGVQVAKLDSLDIKGLGFHQMPNPPSRV